MTAAVAGSAILPLYGTFAGVGLYAITDILYGNDIKGGLTDGIDYLWNEMNTIRWGMLPTIP